MLWAGRTVQLECEAALRVGRLDARSRSRLDVPVQGPLVERPVDLFVGVDEDDGAFLPVQPDNTQDHHLRVLVCRPRLSRPGGTF